MGPQRKEQETSIQQNSSQEAHPVSSGRLLAHQQEPRKPRFSRRTLAIGAWESSALSSLVDRPVSLPPMRKSKKCVFLNGIGH